MAAVGRKKSPTIGLAKHARRHIRRPRRLPRLPQRGPGAARPASSGDGHEPVWGPSRRDDEAAEARPLLRLERPLRTSHHAAGATNGSHDAEAPGSQARTADDCVADEKEIKELSAMTASNTSLLAAGRRRNALLAPASRP